MAGALVVQLFDSMLYSEAGRRGERSGVAGAAAQANPCAPHAARNARTPSASPVSRKCFVLLLFRLTSTFLVYFLAYY